jgi:acetylornithine deacetylase/succinyl-diaminopimelate desuccinylase-like protein
MRDHGPTDRQILRDAQTEQAWGEPGYSAYERVTLRPALTLNGLSGGYQGAGNKGVIPARAVAKLSFRLVPGQQPAEVARLFRQYITQITPQTVRSTVRFTVAANPASIDRQHPALRAAAIAFRQSFGRAPAFLRSGGSIPAVSIFHRLLGVPTVLMGYALPDDGIHAPNEKFQLSNFYQGIETNLRFMHQLPRLFPVR